MSTRGRGPRSKKARLMLSVDTIEDTLLVIQGNRGFDENALVYITATLEYLSAEILELSGDNARENGETTITTEDIGHGIGKDSELVKLEETAKLPEGVSVDPVFSLEFESTLVQIHVGFTIDAEAKSDLTRLLFGFLRAIVVNAPEIPEIGFEEVEEIVGRVLPEGLVRLAQHTAHKSVILFGDD